MHGPARKRGLHVVVAWLLALALVPAADAPAKATDLLQLQQACGTHRAVYEPREAIPLRHPSGFVMTLPGRGCVRVRTGSDLEAHYLLGVTETPDRTMRGVWTGVEATHTATAMILDLATVYPEAPPTTPAEARERLLRDVQALPEGALGNILPHLHRRLDPFPEPIQHPMLTAAFSLRVLAASVGEVPAGGHCVPLRIETEETRRGSGPFSAMLGVRISTIVLRQRFDARSCVAPGGSGVVVFMSERRLEGDADAQARGATLWETGQGLLASIAYRPEGR